MSPRLLTSACFFSPVLLQACPGNLSCKAGSHVKRHSHRMLPLLQAAFSRTKATLTLCRQIPALLSFKGVTEVVLGRQESFPVVSFKTETTSPVLYSVSKIGHSADKIRNVMVRESWQKSWSQRETMWEFRHAVETPREKLKEEIMTTAPAHTAFYSFVFPSHFLLRISHLVSETQKTMPTSLNTTLISVQWV